MAEEIMKKERGCSSVNWWMEVVNQLCLHNIKKGDVASLLDNIKKYEVIEIETDKHWYRLIREKLEKLNIKYGKENKSVDLR